MFKPKLIPLFFPSIRFVKMLLEEMVDVNAQDIEGRTALHHAADAGIPDAVRLLVDYGARGDAKNFFGTTPLDVANFRAKNGSQPHIVCRDILLSAASPPQLPASVVAAVATTNPATSSPSAVEAAAAAVAAFTAATSSASSPSSMATASSMMPPGIMQLSTSLVNPTIGNASGGGGGIGGIGGGIGTGPGNAFASAGGGKIPTDVSILPFYEVGNDTASTKFLENHEAAYAQVYSCLK